MEKKNYLVVVDTVEANSRVTLPRGILNTFVVQALDPLHAKKIVQNLFNRSVSDQLADALYIYDLNDVTTNLTALDQQNKLPLFSYMPLNGARPPKQNDVNITSLGNQTLAPNPGNNNVKSPLTAVRGGRSQEFREVEQSRPTVSNDLTPEQARLAAGLGALPAGENRTENSNLRVNAATGVNPNLAVRRAEPQKQSSPEQQELLSRLGVSIPQPTVDPELLRELEETGTTAFVDDSLTQINEKPLGEEDLKRLQND